MLIRITGNAKVSIYGAPKDEIRNQLNGAESADSCCRYLPNEYRDLGIVGGKIRLKLNADAQTFSVVTEYHVPEQLDERSMDRLVKLTTGQWSDGLGAGCFEELGRNLGARILLLPIFHDDQISKEQIDDGVHVSPPKDSVYRAARDGDLATVERLLDEGCDIDECRDGTSPLISAVLGGFREVALQLISRGANVHYFDARLETDALMATATSNRITDEDAAAIAQTLLSLGVSANGKRGSNTPLSVTRIRGKKKLERVLLKHGAEDENQGVG